jgi:hypothetical protein
MPLSDGERYLAENCYGYGRWDADYWFIGLEEGQAPWEKNDFSRRAEVFRELNKRDGNGLTDCREFHDEIGEKRWHHKNPKTGKIDLQSTWRYLVLLLFAVKECPKVDLLRDDLKRVYQAERWGVKDNVAGETCVIELSGLPANNSTVSKERPKDVQEQLGAIVPNRIKRIRHELTDNPKRRFVVMYGMTQKKNWERIAGCRLQEGVPARVGLTTFIVAKHPVAFFAKGTSKDEYWIELGKKFGVESN